MKLERRIYKAELRAAGDRKQICGYAAVFNAYSEEMWGFYEVIEPGAFAEALPRSDVRCLLNHDANYVLGRTKSGTLSLREDNTGLYIENDPPDTQWAKDLQISMQRGDIDQMSFAFIVAEAHWRNTHNGLPVRTITKFEQIYDVSVVTFPAYPSTSANVRSAKEIFAEYKPEPPPDQPPVYVPSVDILKRRLKIKEANQ